MAWIKARGLHYDAVPARSWRGLFYYTGISDVYGLQD